MKHLLPLLTLLFAALPLRATRLMGVRIVDKNYLMVHFRDGEIRYRDDATGRSAYLGHTFVEGDDTLLVFGQRLVTSVAQQPNRWRIRSTDDASFGSVRPRHVWRKSKPMHIDHTLQSELDHWLFLELPKPMRQGFTYTVEIPSATGSDKKDGSVIFDVWNSPSEALHVNIIGYPPTEDLHPADLYLWLGDGGGRDYREWEGRRVFLYNIATKEKTAAGKVSFWKPASAAEHEAGRMNLTGSDVWNIDFRAATPGRYRLVVEDVGCSMDFDIAADIYFQPYRFSLRGYYYMRLGEPIDTPHVWPVPRQPRFVPGTDPKELVIYKTDLTPWSPEWRALRSDVWDEPHFKSAQESLFWKHRLPGNPVNASVRGGHSDAMDWDRHLAHVGNIYDLLLPYLLSEGRLSEDNLGIRESGNRLPDLIDEARNEVDFFLSIRDGEAYSQGVTNPSKDWTVMFQAGCTTMAAWANAANCAMLGEAFRICGIDSLRRYYTNEAIRAFRFADRQSRDKQQLDDKQDVGNPPMRGRDFRQMAAAYLYNLTGQREWERIMAEACPEPSLHLPWAAAAYILTPHPRHYPRLYADTKAAIDLQTQTIHLERMARRPSRRPSNDPQYRTSENLHTVMLAHYLADSKKKKELQQAMQNEASWGLGRNPGNIVEMTGLGQRHITDCYSTGRNDGMPGTHPGQTPFNGTQVWTEGNGGDARLILRRCYPDWDKGAWPQQETYFNQRYFWVNSEFTPRTTMRGKMALLAYLYAITSR
ncbi:MAG: glycoside hydrolase family 9 protein [Bacteroidaceae bacterium]|nr:glycoside hydrolase family 9 protein [Bacteroidaceae bacterium]